MFNYEVELKRLQKLVDESYGVRKAAFKNKIKYLKISVEGEKYEPGYSDIDSLDYRYD